MPFFMGEIFISSLKFSWVNPEIFGDENEIFMHEKEIFMHENENFAHEMKISPMKWKFQGWNFSYGLSPCIGLSLDMHTYINLWRQLKSVNSCESRPPLPQIRTELNTCAAMYHVSNVVRLIWHLKSDEIYSIRH